MYIHTLYILHLILQTTIPSLHKHTFNPSMLTDTCANEENCSQMIETFMTSVKYDRKQTCVQHQRLESPDTANRMSRTCHVTLQHRRADGVCL